MQIIIYNIGLLLKIALKREHKKREWKHNDKESEIKRRENEKVFQGFTGIMSYVFTEGDKTCEGWYDGAASADVYSKQKLAVIIGKLREQDSRRNVTHKLARECADNECALIEQGGEQLSYRIDPRHISREYEEENKG